MRLAEQQGPRKTFAKVNVRGLIEIIDAQTFELVAVQRPSRDPSKPLEERLIRTDLPDGRTILVEAGIQDFGETIGYPFSDIVVDLVCQQLTEGKSLTKICKSPGFPPYYIFTKWMRKHPWVREAIDQARRDRAEYIRDELIDIADSVKEDQDSINKAKLQVDAKKWAAQIDDPNRFSKPEKSVQAHVPLQIIVNTGIIRPGDPGFRDVEDLLHGKNLTGASTAPEQIGGNSGDSSAPASFGVPSEPGSDPSTTK